MSDYINVDKIIRETPDVYYLSHDEKAKLSDEAVSAIIEYMIQARDFLNDELKQIGEAI